MLVCDTFELVTLINELCILKFDLVLLFHDFRDFIGHHVRHFLTHIVLQLIEEVQLLDHLDKQLRIS